MSRRPALVVDGVPMPLPVAAQLVAPPAPTPIPGLALAMIARDEAPNIRRALDSVRGRCAPLIVVDTGSTDDTREIAAAAGAIVSLFDWRDDFSAAKNYALDMAREAGARYALVLDADEEITGGWEQLRAWIAGDPEALGCVRITNHTDNGPGVVFSVARVIPLKGGAWSYHGRIHENPRGPGEPSGVLLEVDHYGYTRAEIVRKDKAARIGLMRQELAELATDDPRRPYLHWQIARSLAQGGALDRPRPPEAPAPETDDAHPLHHLCRAAQLGSERAPWWPMLVRDLALALSRCRRRYDAIRLLWGVRGRWPDYTDLVALEAMILYDVGEPQTDAEAERLFLRAIEQGDAPSDRYASTPGAGSYLGRYYLGRLAERRDDLAQALEHYAKAAPHHAPARLAIERLQDAQAPPPTPAAQEAHGPAPAA